MGREGQVKNLLICVVGFNTENTVCFIVLHQALQVDCLKTAQILLLVFLKAGSPKSGSAR